jgi:hypothetical protein
MKEEEILGHSARPAIVVQQDSLQPVREYKDRLFKKIFGDTTEESKRWRLDLYNALNGTSYTDPDELKLTTIENVIYVTMKNDISFLIGSQMNLYEQRLPLREANDFLLRRKSREISIFTSLCVA